MRTIQNIGNNEVMEILLVFSSQEERLDYFQTQRDRIEREHRDKLEKLRSWYLSKTNEDPAQTEEVHKSYMTQVKKEYESIMRLRADLIKKEETSLLEEDLQKETE